MDTRRHRILSRRPKRERRPGPILYETLRTGLEGGANAQPTRDRRDHRWPAARCRSAATQASGWTCVWRTSLLSPRAVSRTRVGVDGREARRSDTVRESTPHTYAGGPWVLGNPRACSALTGPPVPSRAVTTFAVKFLGCKVSQADAMLARAALIRAGHTEAPESEAELHVINTCCITGEAEAKSRQSVRRSLRETADRRVFVSGCAVNLHAGQFAEIDHRVSPFVGTAEDVAESMSADLGACADLEHDLLARDPITPAARTRGFVKVQDGCDCQCAYCIIPTVRGPARSRPASRDPRRGRAPRRGGSARDGDDRDQRRRLPRPRARARARRADARGGPGPRRRARPPVQRRGDPRQGIADRGARHRAEGLPPPARPDAVRRRPGARGHGPPLRRRRVPASHRSCCARPRPT